jgi:hypothetical protein
VSQQLLKNTQLPVHETTAFQLVKHLQLLHPAAPLQVITRGYKSACQLQGALLTSHVHLV